MFDNDYDTKEGVSVWGHVLDGAAMGGGVGALFGGVGAIPGAIGGGILGLINGLHEQGEEDAAHEDWKKKLDHDPKMAKEVSKTMDAESNAIIGDKGQLEKYKQKDGEYDSAAIVDKAMDRAFYKDYAKDDRSKSSWFGDLF